MKHILSILILVAFSIPMMAQTKTLTNDARLLAKAADILRRENVIQSKSIAGFQATQPTEQGWAVSIILKKARNPADNFAAIAETGSYVGLLGVYMLDREKFESVLERFRASEKVIVVTGDQIEEMSAEEFVREFLPQRGRTVFEKLQFKDIPDLVDTVRGEPRG